MSNVPSSFDSYEDMLAFMEQQNKKNPSEKKVATSSSGDSPDHSKVWRAEHYFLRAGYSWTEVLKQAKDASQMGNPETNKVFAHHHLMGEECQKLCKTL